MNETFARCLALTAALACSIAAAQTMYKLIDKDGKVTYSNEEPKNFDGKVIRIEVNPNANTATLPKLQPEPPKGGEGVKRLPAHRPASPAKPDLDALRQKVADRRAALQEAENNPSDDDVQWLGNTKGGVRRVPTEAYQARITQLERQLKEAEDELRQAEKDEQH